MNKTLEIKNLTKYYGETLGVKDLSLELYEGEIFGFIGSNGAGKSTTIRSIMNLINRTSGNVFFMEKELKKDAVDLKKQIGYLPSEINLYDDFTVKEMLDYHEKFFEEDIHDKRTYLVDKLKLDEKKKIEDLSLGNLKKVGIILALMHSPKLLIMDEPTSGLDPIIQNVFYELLKEEKARGTTIFYSTHILGEITKICDRVGIIKEGQLLSVERVSDLSKKSLNVVTITSKEIEKVVKAFNLEEEIRDNTVQFKSTMSSDILIKTLSSYTIDNILIEEPTLEEMFLHYYE